MHNCVTDIIRDHWIYVLECESLGRIECFHSRGQHLCKFIGTKESVCISRPVAGGGAGGARAPPEIFRLELNSATKVEFFY